MAAAYYKNLVEKIILLLYPWVTPGKDGLNAITGGMVIWSRSDTYDWSEGKRDFAENTHLPAAEAQVGPYS